MPSPVALVVAWCRAHAALAPLHGGRVGVILGQVFPAVRVALVSTNPTHVWEARPVVQVEAWAADPDAVDLLARTLIAALPDLVGPHPGGALVKAAEVVAGPYWSPDDVGELHRMQFDTELYLYSATTE